MNSPLFRKVIMNYYKEIKNELVNNEIYKKVKDYSKNRSDLNTYYRVGKLLSEAHKQYGEGIIKEYSHKLTLDLNKEYNVRNLYNMRKYYTKICCSKILQPVAAKLTWSHYCELLSLKDETEILYYIQLSINLNLSKRELKFKIKNKEYERLDNKTKEKLVTKEHNKIKDFIKNPILIKNNLNYTLISEKILKNLILENLSNFMKELGPGFSYIDNEYKIKLGDRYNYIDLLLFNIQYNCYVVVELKVTELKSQYIGQIKKYMNFIDRNVKKITQEPSIGIIICKKDNQFVMEYCSDERIFRTVYSLG